MKFLAALVSLVATASAVDLYLERNNDCGGGNALRCNGINPNTCCGTNQSDSPYQSIAVRGIPEGWNLQGRGYAGGNCARLMTVSGNNGNRWICNRSNGFRYSGAGYNFVNLASRVKRDEPEVVKKSECQRPNALVLADGSEYDLTSLTDDDFENLVAIGMNATGPADIPQQLLSLQIK